MSDRSRFPIVALGGSAGALSSFFTFFDGFDRQTDPPPMAFIVILHLAPQHKSHLLDLLASRSSLQVRNVDERTPIEPGHIYVLPPNKRLVVSERALEPRRRAAGSEHHPVDDIFESLASSFGERVIAMVFSGTGSNGSEGARAVRAAGGTVIAQSPDEAEFEDMPRRAMATGVVQRTALAAEMVEIVLRTARSLQQSGLVLDEKVDDAGASRAKDGDPSAQAPFERILRKLRAETRIDFHRYKTGTLQRRIQRRADLLGMTTLEHYADHLSETPEEVEALLGDLLITVTSFFRDPNTWDTLNRRVITPLTRDRPEDQPLRAWVAGCATGEEAYSLAILLFEAAAQHGASSPIEIFATDIAQEALRRARRGQFPAAAIQNMRRTRRERWFDSSDDIVTIKPALREAMIFAPHNLIEDPPFSRMDLVICRNVLIYLRTEAQQNVLRLLHFALKDGGYLFLGSAESTGEPSDMFEPIDKSAQLYRRRGSLGDDLAKFAPPLVRPSRTPRAPVSLERRRSAEQSYADLAGRALLARFSPPSVLVDEQFNVRYYHGNIERFLRGQSGEPTNDMLTLARDGLAPHLRHVVEAVARARAAAVVRVPLRPDGESKPLRIEGIPLPAEHEPRHILISFHEEELADPLPESASFSSREEALAHEVCTLREELGDMAYLARRAEEDVTAYNEEIISMNEELRASNEELETSKEEMQSLNEELSTVNLQLNMKLAKLGERNADLDNLMTSTGFATLFLGPSLEVRWFSPRIEELFHIRSVDIDRPISHLVRRFFDETLEEDCRRVLRSLAPVDAQVETSAGHTYQRRITPYRTQDDRIAGVVITFNDITEIEAARRYAERIVETVPTPFLVIDRELRVRSANPAFYTTFKTKPELTEGRLIYDLGDGQWNIPDLRRLLSQVLPADELFEGYEVTHTFEHIGRKTMLLNGRRLEDLELVLLAIEDITERQRSAERQAILMGELQHRVKNTLSVIQSLASQTLKRSGSLQEFKTAFTGRLQAYARSHDQLLARQWQTTSLHELIQTSIQAHVVDSGRVRIGGPPIEIPSRQVLALDLILHELETNAAKYGALSADSGQVEIDWVQDDQGRLRLRWRESGGPAASKPEKEGFGSILIRQLVQYELGGKTMMSFPEEGFTCELLFKPSERTGSLDTNPG